MQLIQNKNQMEMRSIKLMEPLVEKKTFASFFCNSQDIGFPSFYLRLRPKLRETR